MTDATEPVEFLITLHGIRDNGRWQEVLEDVYADQSEHTRHERFKYGFFDLLKFVFPWSRDRQVKQFSERLAALLSAISRRANGAFRVHFAAHSFGTHVVAHTLLKLPIEYRSKVGNIVLMGSVLPSHFDAMSLALIGPATRVCNFCSVNDFILLLNAALPLSSGLAGRIGFKDVFEGSLIVQRFFRFGHGGYFRDMHLGKKSWLGRYCVPALLNEKLQAGSHHRPRYGDFLADFMRFSKLVLLWIMLSATITCYAMLTSGGALRYMENTATTLEAKSLLSILDLPDVLSLSPSPIYWVFEQIRDEAHRQDRLYDRIAAENRVVFALLRDDIRQTSMRESDMALLVSRNDGVAIYTNSARAGEGLNYTRRLIAKGKMEQVGFTSAGNPYVISNSEMRICQRCDGDWRRFPVPDPLWLNGLAVSRSSWLVHELPDGGVVLYYSRGSVDGESLFFLRERQQPIQVRLTSAEESEVHPTPAFGLKITEANNVTVAPLLGAFQGFVALADRNSVLLAGRDSTSIFISHDPEDLEPLLAGLGAEAPKAKRRAQIKNGASENNSGQFCDESGCNGFSIAFLATGDLPPESLVFDAYSKGSELLIEIYTIRKNAYPIDTGRAPSYCLRIARMVDGKLRPITLPEEQRASCDSSSSDHAYSHRRDAAVVDVEDPHLLEIDRWIAITSNPKAYAPYRQETSVLADSVGIKRCASWEDGEAINNVVVYSKNGMLAVRCWGNLFVENEWGRLKTIRLEPKATQYPLFLPGRGAVLAIQDERSVSIHDSSSDFRTVRSLIKVQEGVPSAEPWVTFASEDGASLTWLMGSEIVASKYYQAANGEIQHKIMRASLGARQSDFGEFVICGTGVFVEKAHEYEGNRVHPRNDAAKSVTLIEPGAPMCRELGAPVFALRMDGENELLVDGYALTPELRQSSNLQVRIRRHMDGSIVQKLKAFYASAIRSN